LKVSRTPLIVGNWKMHTLRDEAVALARGVAKMAPENIEIAVCPPFPWLVDVRDALESPRVTVGAQNCWSVPFGAFTGEVSPVMLAELCEFVIIGHSERRRVIGEPDAVIAAKLRAALAAGLRAILCVGEDLQIRQTGKETEFVAAQLDSALENLPLNQLSHCVIAYEPIWAIGTGVAAEPADAQTMCFAIRQRLHASIASSTRILYGGSVSGANAEAILRQPDVDGALVGSASLKVESFAEIMVAASRCA
jgi:triosephosphate isomerase